MRWLPWVGREMHLAVIAAKNEVISNLQRNVACLEEQLKKPVPVNVNVEMPTVQVPAPAFHRRKDRGAAPAPADEAPIDWSLVNENDNEQIAKLAHRELGGSYTPYMLAQCVSRIKRNVYMARQAKARKLMEEGRRAAGLSPETTRPPTPDVDEALERIPENILSMIEDAEAS